MQRYRSGHNGADSKTVWLFGSVCSRKPSVHAGFREYSVLIFMLVLSFCSVLFPGLDLARKTGRTEDIT